MMKRKAIGVILAGVITVMISACGGTDSGAQATDAQGDISATESAEEVVVKPTAEPTRSPEEVIDEALTEGRNYYYGYNDVTADNDKAMEAFEKAADLGSADAFYYIARIQDRAEEYEKAKESYDKAVELGSSMAKIGLGMLYQKGKAVDKDFDKARALYEEAIDEGCIEANVGLGDIYQSGYGTDADAVKSMEYFELAATGDETEWVCYAYMSMCYLNTGVYEGIEKNEDIIDEYGEKLCDLCRNWNPENMDYVGLAFELAENYEMANKYFEKGEQLGDAESINRMTRLYFFGEGVEQDYDKALEYAEKAGSMGNVHGMENAADMYRYADYGRQDIDKAVEWYEKAAELDDC
ncbi:MAG: sel1 repeat family protein, partial [Lachnospiraceae bacterium]|nr:sel1 repeat family protein [Lachnospiraceae bacterium]